MITALSKAPGLDKIGKADGIVVFAGRDLLIAIALKNVQFLGLCTLVFSRSNREQKSFELDNPL